MTILNNISPLRRLRIAIKRLLPASLLGRSLLILIAPILLGQGIATFVFFDRHWDDMTHRLSRAVAGEIAIVAERLEEQGVTGLDKSLTLGVSQKLNLRVSFEDGKTQLDHQTSDVWLTGASSQVMDNFYDVLNRPFVLRTRQSGKLVEVSVLLSNGVLRVLVPEKRLISSTGRIFLLWMLGSSFFLLIIAIIFMRNQIKPIRRLAMAADRLGRGLEVPPLREQGAREVRQASRAFELMRERLKRQIEQRTAMLAGVSHDLRTPIARLRLELELLDDKKTAQAMKKDLAEMERMIEGYLSFARGEAEKLPAPCDVTKLVRESIRDHEKQGAKMHGKLENDVTIILREAAFKRCLDNVIGNAVKYGEEVWVHLSKDEDFLSIVVEDDGPGVPDDKKEEIFKPFFRLEKSRNQSTGGVGLGLSIARDIVHTHGGRIELKDSQKNGLCVLIQVPA